MKIRDIILIILALIAVGITIWYIFGSSPSFEQTLLVLIITILFANSIKISSIKTKLNLFEKSFAHLAKDFKEHIQHK